MLFRSLDLLIGVGADHADIVTLDRTGLEQIEPLTLGDAFDHVHQDYIGEFLIGNSQCTIGSDVSGANDRDFFSQGRHSFFGKMRNPIIAWRAGAKGHLIYSSF